MRHRLPAVMADQFHGAVIAANGSGNYGHVAQVVLTDIHPQTFEGIWIWFYAYEAASTYLWFSPQSEHANVSADIDHRIVVLQLETRMGVLPALKGFPAQVFGDSPHCRGGEVTSLPVGKAKHQTFTHSWSRDRT